MVKYFTSTAVATATIAGNTTSLVLDAAYHDCKGLCVNSVLSLLKSILRNAAEAFTRPNMLCASGAGKPSYRRRSMDNKV